MTQPTPSESSHTPSLEVIVAVFKAQQELNNTHVVKAVEDLANTTTASFVTINTKLDELREWRDRQEGALGVIRWALGVLALIVAGIAVKLTFVP